MDAKIVSPWSEMIPAALAPGGRPFVRPESTRQPGYGEQFDALTWWYDLIGLDTPGEYIAVAPPLASVMTPDAPLQFIDGSGSVCDHSVSHFNLLSEIHIRSDAPPAACRIAGDSVSEQPLRCSPSEWAVFSGRKVLLTLQKDNALPWIYDWAAYHVEHHGVDAVLLYDNQSTSYDCGRLLGKLQRVRGLEVVRVVEWFFPYGPDPGPKRIWDSQFAQCGALAHARRRFLGSAAGVLGIDIDELVVTRSGKSVFDLCSENNASYARFPGHWVAARQAEAPPGAPLVRHHEHRYRLSPAPSCPAKWVAVPSGLPPLVQWRVHEVSGAEESPALSGEISYRHCHGISNSWKTPRDARLPDARLSAPDDLLPFCRDAAGPAPPLSPWPHSLPFSSPDMDTKSQRELTVVTLWRPECGPAQRRVLDWMMTEPWPEGTRFLWTAPEGGGTETMLDSAWRQFPGDREFSFDLLQVSGSPPETGAEKHLLIAGLYSEAIADLDSRLALFVEDDNIPPAGAWQAIADRFASLPADTAGVMGAYLSRVMPGSICAGLNRLGYFPWSRTAETDPIPADWIAGGFTLYCAEDLKACAPLRPTLGDRTLGWDIDLCRKLGIRQRKVYVEPRIQVQHVCPEVDAWCLQAGVVSVPGLNPSSEKGAASVGPFTILP